MKIFRTLYFVLVNACFLTAQQINYVTYLCKHNVYRDSVTLSGFSSGGTFAQQLQISHSSLFSGIATFNHAYYRCGPGDGTEEAYDNACTIINPNSQAYDPNLARADIEQYESFGLIDNTRNLRNKRLYVYAGSRSSFFSLEQSLGVLKIYEPLIQNPLAIKTRVQDAEQLFPTESFGGECSAPADNSFFLGRCGFSGAHEALNFLLKPETDIVKPIAGTQVDLARLLPFDQTEFFYGFAGPHFMDTIGYIYVPRQCQRNKCYLHFYFHGCLTGREFNGTNHIINTGFLELAEVNNLIVVFPQALGTGFNPPNQIGCWDTYGISDRRRNDGRVLYATKRGPQVTVVRNMLARLVGDHNNFLNYEGPSTRYQLEGRGSSFPIQLEAQSIEPARTIFTESSSLHESANKDDKNAFTAPTIIRAFEESTVLQPYY